MRKKINLSYLKEKWPSSIVARFQIREFTGGALEPGRIANLDSEGNGPKGRLKVGRKIAYNVDELVAWLEERTQILS
jgi:hypothetical protein